MVVGFITTYAVGAYHHQSIEFEPCSWHAVLDTTFMIKFVSETCQWFSPSIPASSTNKTDRHDIAEILLKMALNTINYNYYIYLWHMYK